MKMLNVTTSFVTMASEFTALRGFTVRSSSAGFPSFLPKEVDKIKDPFARKLATRIERLSVPVKFTENSIMTSCVRPLIKCKTSPVVLLHGFDSSCLEWRYTYPLLEDAGLETWAVDILGWGFSDLERLPSCDVASKRHHFYELWKSYIQKPMILVGPSLGAAVAIDFAVNHPEAVQKLVLIDASVYTEGTGNLATLPKWLAYAGVSLLKSIPLRLYVNFLAFNDISISTSLDWTNIGRLHCLLPWWEDATVDFMRSGGYKVGAQIEQVKQKTLIIWGEDDKIISNKLAVRLQCELPNATIRQIADCGHLPHVEKPREVAKLIEEFVQEDCSKELAYSSLV
ncbi:alpha/beta hydrolase domain-containing protein VTE7 [Ziziphus jujuba]|uniref:Alpha/beta hydrolase domain-containing protein VTE7 n=1 Tax=Ziziphus jujuba TaxID=326968 RepID=A0ABM3I125_ZIZJJ|nr:alpha/beta hydrolase domain-containing protein VTE7 [Ziziphus jujuba]